jgi:hypothetical protein
MLPPEFSMQKTTLFYLPAIATAIVDMNERDSAARHTFQRHPPSPVELLLTGVFQAGDRRRVVYRIEVEGREVGTATEWADKPLAPWRLTLPGHCANFVQLSRDALMEAVARIFTTGSIWS